MELNSKKLSFIISLLFLKYFFENSSFFINCTTDSDIYYKQFQALNLNIDKIIKVVKLHDNKMVVATVDNTLLIYDIENGFSLVNTLSGHTDRITSVIQLLNGDIASTGVDKTIRVWDESQDYSIRKILTDNNEIYSLTQTDSGVFISGYSDGAIKLWQTFNESKNFTTHTAGIFCLIALSNGFIATGSDDGLIKIWNETNNYTIVQTLTGHTKAIRSILQLNNEMIATSSDDCLIKIWNITSDDSNDTLFTTLDKHSKPVNTLVSLENGLMASGSDDSRIYIWNTEEFSLNNTIETGSKVTRLYYLDTKMLVSGHADGSINVWDMQNDYSLSYTIKGDSFAVTSLIQLKTGWMVSGYMDGKIRIHDTHLNFTLIHILKQHPDAVFSLLELDNEMIVSGSSDKSIKILNPYDSFSQIDSLVGHTGNVTGLIQLYSGVMISSSEDGSIKIWNMTTKQINSDHHEMITDMKLLDGILISSSLDQTINIHNINEKYKLVKTLKGHTGGVNTIELIDDNLFASGSIDKNIKIWNKTDNYSLVKTLIGHTNSVQALCKLTNEVLLSGGNNTRLKAWNINNDFNFIQTLEKRTKLILAINEKNFLTVTNNSNIDIYQLSNVKYFYKNNNNNFTLNEYLGSDNSTSIVFNTISQCNSTIFIDSVETNLNITYNTSSIFTYKGYCDSNFDELNFSYYYYDDNAQEKLKNINLTILFENAPYLWQPVSISGESSKVYNVDLSDKIYDEKFSISSLKIEFLSLPTQGILLYNDEENIEINIPYQVLQFEYDNTNNTGSNVTDSFSFTIINEHNLKSEIYTVHITLCSHGNLWSSTSFVIGLMCMFVGTIFIIVLIIHVCKRKKYCCWKDKLSQIDIEKLKDSHLDNCL